MKKANPEIAHLHGGQVIQPSEILGTAFIDAIRQVVREEVSEAIQMMDGARDDRLLTVKEAATIVNRSEYFFYRNPELPFLVKQGRKTLISSNKLQEWVATL